VNRALVVQLLIAVLAAGLFKFITDLFGVRRAHRLEGPERDGIVTKGAESAVLSLQAALTASDRQVAALREEVAEVKAELVTARSDAVAARLEAVALRAEVHELTDQLHGYVHRAPGTRARATDQKDSP
jgi:hypothetical protein